MPDDAFKDSLITPADWSDFLGSGMSLGQETIICGGTCATLPSRLNERFPFKHYDGKLDHLLRSIVKRGTYVRSKDFKDNPFDPSNPDNPVGRYEYVFDYGPSTIKGDVLWLLNSTKAAFFEGHPGIDRIEAIEGERNTVNVMFEDGRVSRMKISDLTKRLPSDNAARVAIDESMTKLSPHGKRRVEIIISTDPMDIISKSTNQGWTSCEALDGSYSQGIHDDLKNYNAIAIFRDAPEGKPFPKSWTGRFMLRWCYAEDEGEAAVGIEPRGYGGNANLNKFVHSKIEEILEGHDLWPYSICVTPYNYSGFSDQRASVSTCDRRDDIVYGDGASEYCREEGGDTGPSQEDYDAFFEEWDHYGICWFSDVEDFDHAFFEGTLSDLLRHADSDNYDPRTDSFGDITGCTTIDKDATPEDYAIYKMWDHLVNDGLVEDVEGYWMWDNAHDNDIDQRTLGQYVLFKKGDMDFYTIMPLVPPGPKMDYFRGIEFDDGKIVPLYNAYFKASECFQKVVDDWTYERIKEEKDFDEQYAKCAIGLRDDLLAGAGIKPENVVEIPADFDEAVAKLEGMDLSVLCKAISQTYPAKSQFGRYERPLTFVELPWDTLKVADHEIYGEESLLKLQHMRLRTRDLSEPCTPLLPLAYKCKLPVYRIGERGEYEAVPWEVWSKDPKFRCPFPIPEEKEEGQ